MESETVTKEPIAVVGLGCVLPDAPDVTTFWANLVAGRSSIREVPQERWDPTLFWDADRLAPNKTYAKIGAFVTDDSFAAMEYRMPPKVLEQVDPSQRWALAAARQALRDAGYKTGLKGDEGRDFDRSRCAVILGNAMGGEQMKLQAKTLYWPQVDAALRSDPDFRSLSAEKQAAVLDRTRTKYQSDAPPITEDSMPGTLSNVAAGRIANTFDLGGKNFTTDAACASSLAALDAAIDTLRKGEADMIVCGGTDRSMDITPYVEFSKIGALSPDGSRPFDKDANGFVMGEGCAILLLRRLSDAQRDGDKVYAVIRGVGGSSDGKGKGITAPNPRGQVLAVRRAYEDAGVDPFTLGFVEAHGTSTPVGDPVELQSAEEAFRALRPDATATPGTIAVGSVKSNLGHLKSAAGAVGLLKAVLALHHGKIPPSINVQALNPRIEWARSPFRVQTEPVAWPRPATHPRRAAVSSFGFGGTNFHVVLEEHIPGRLQVARDGHAAMQAAATPGGTATSAPAGAPDPAALRRHMESHAALEGEPIVLAASDVTAALALAPPAFAATGRGPRLRDLLHPLTRQGILAAERVGFHVADVAEIPKKLEMAQKAVTNPAAARLAFNQGIYLGRGEPRGKVAFLFPGQGTQYVNMGRDLAAKYAVVRNTFAEADEVLFDELDGVRLTDILWPTPDTEENRRQSEERLKLTEYTQPAVLAMDVAMLRVLRQWGMEPDVVAGHSLGEYGALVAAGVMSFADALHAVAARGREMAHVEVPDLGKMASVSADWTRVEAAIRDVDEYVICANKNCPSQTVIAGSSPGVEKAVATLQADGLQCMFLPVSAAFHSDIVAPASRPLRSVLARLDVHPPRVRVLSNVGAKPYPEDPDAIRDNLAVQVASPVEWIGIIERMYEEGVRTFIEVGPKRALSGFVADILTDKDDVRPVFANHPKKGGIASLNELFAFLAASGLRPTQSSLDDPAVYTPEFRDPAAHVAVASPALPAAARTAPHGPGTPVAAAAPASAGAPAPVTPPDPRLDSIARHLEALSHELADLRAGQARSAAAGAATPAQRSSAASPAQAPFVAAPAQGPTAATAATHAPHHDIGISGISVGLPGRHKPFFAADDWDRILRGENLIDVLGDDERRAMATKHITRLVKSAGGQGTFEAIDDPQQVIKLAGRRGPFDLREWGVDEELLETLDVTSQYAIAAGLEALRDAGIPLQRTYRQTSTGGQLPQGWALPRSIGDRTGIIFASAFPGYDALLQEVKRAGRQEAFNRKFLFHVLAMGHSQLAQFLGARGPNTQVNAACASTTQAIAIAEDWIKADRCDRVLVVGADDATSENMMEWIGSGFLASGAATTKEDVAQAALPFDARRHGMIIGMGAVGLVVERTDATKERGMRSIARLLATQVSNSAYHGSRLDVEHIAAEMRTLLARAGVDPKEVAARTIFMSHETYTPARGGSAAAEIHALRATFGDAANKVVVANTKGFTGHPQGAGIEDAVVLKCLQRGEVPPIPHLREPDPELGDLNLSKGGRYDVHYALRLAAGFGSQVAMTFTELVAREGERVADAARYEAWLAAVSGIPGAKTEVAHRTLRIVDAGPPKRPVPAVEAPLQEAAAAPAVLATAAPALTPTAAAPALPPTPALATIRPAASVAASTVSPVPSPGGAVDVEAALARITQVVADKTGYPLELLEPDLDLEADLGIDTVKQAELFGQLREMFGVPLREDLQLKDYNTLRKVASYMAQGTGAASLATAASASPAPDPPAVGTAPSAATMQEGDDALAKVTAVVAEKTGYPVELLEPDLDLEADLGIDTVKQAELFGQLREMFGVPLREDLQLKDYNTLRKVASYMQGSAATGAPAGPPAPSTAPAASPTPTATPAPPSPSPPTPAATADAATSSPPPASTHGAGDSDALATVTQVIADKTGYPADMLEPDLDLEADLGIDTVKQAELFGQLREMFGVPLREDLQLKDYNTLRKVASYMAQGGKGVPAATPTPGSTGSPQTPATATVPPPASSPAPSAAATPSTAVPASAPMHDAPTAGGPPDPTTVPIRRLAPVLRPQPLPDEETGIVPGPVQVLAHDDAVWNAFEASGFTKAAHDDAAGLLVLATRPGRDAADAAGDLFEAAKAHPGVSFVCIVTAQDGAHGLRAPRDGAMAALVGLGKALRKELPNAVVKVIDVAPDLEEAGIRTVEELLRGGRRTEVCYGGDGTRFVVEVAPSPLADTAPDVAGKTLVVSGGAQGITVELLAALAPQGPRLLLLGRTDVPDEAAQWAAWDDAAWKAEETRVIEALRAAGEKPTPVLVKRAVDPKRKAAEVHRNVSRLRTAGADVMYAAVDVLDAAAVSAAVDAARKRFGAIHGVVHAAGIEVSKQLADKPREQFDQVFAVKVQGLENLLGATERDDLSFIVGFGSVAGRFGNLGQTDYSAANECLAKRIAQAAHSRGIATASTLAWGPWGDVGMATRGGIMTVLRASGVTPIPTGEGTAAFLREIATPGVRECVVAGALGMLDVDDQVVERAWDPAVAEAESWLQTAPERFRLLRALESFVPGEALVASVVLDRRNDPYLRDHAIDGVPLLPGVFGIEAFAQAARLLAPEDEVLLGARDVRFANPLKQHKDDPVTARVEARLEDAAEVGDATDGGARGNAAGDGEDPRPSTRVRCRLTSRFVGPDGRPLGDDRVHFEATLLFGRAAEPLETADVPMCDESVPPARIYPPFFHGPSFQVLAAAGPIAADEATGAWHQPDAALFAAGDAVFQSHPLVTEGLFQLCGLRTLLVEERMSLPAGITRLDFFESPGAVRQARLWCRSAGRTDDGLRRFDAAACTPEGRVLVRMQGYSMVETGPAPPAASAQATPGAGPSAPSTQRIPSPAPSSTSTQPIPTPAPSATSTPTTPGAPPTKDPGAAPARQVADPADDDVPLPEVPGIVFAVRRISEGSDGGGRLTPAEEKRAGSFASRKRAADWVAGRLAAKNAVRDAEPALADGDIEVQEGKDGAPVLLVRGTDSPAHLSITHRDGLALAALSDDAVGIDLEVNEPRAQSFWDEAFGKDEQEHLRSAGDHDLAATCAWAAKEACLKRLGKGLQVPLHSLHVRPAQDGATVHGPFGAWGVRFFDVAGRVLAVTHPSLDPQTTALASEGAKA